MEWRCLTLDDYNRIYDKLHASRIKGGNDDDVADAMQMLKDKVFGAADADDPAPHNISRKLQCDHPAINGWEYRMEETTATDWDRWRYNDVMRRRGADGWEAFAVLPGDGDTVRVFMRRPLAEEKQEHSYVYGDGPTITVNVPCDDVTTEQLLAGVRAQRRWRDAPEELAYSLTENGQCVVYLRTQGAPLAIYRDAFSIKNEDIAAGIAEGVNRVWRWWRAATIPPGEADDEANAKEFKERVERIISGALKEAKLL